MIIILLFVLFVVMLIGGIKLSCGDHEGIGMSMVIVSILSLIMIFVGFGAGYCDSQNEVVKYYAVKSTIENARFNEMDALEKATLINKIIETNSTIASYKYWDKVFIIKEFIVDEVNNLVPLK
jgi:hypothetical protein